MLQVGICTDRRVMCYSIDLDIIPAALLKERDYEGESDIS